MSNAAFVRNPRRDSRRVDRRDSGRFGGASPVTIALGFAVLGLLLYALSVLVVFPRLRISRIHVHADFEIGRDVLLERAGLTGRTYYFSVRTDQIAARLEEHPMVKTASVERVFPDGIRLELVRRRPIALTVVSGEEGSILAAVDEEGVIYDAGSHLAGVDLPVISGIEYQGSPLGSTMPETLQRFLGDLERLRREEPRLFDRISELMIVPRRSGSFDTLLFTADYRVPVRLDAEISAEVFRWSLMVLDVLEQQGISEDVAEVDFRSGEIVYKMKEDSDGR